MAQQTAVMQIAKSFRDWQRAWDSFDKDGLDKPPSFDEFVEPFLAMEKEQIINAFIDGDFMSTGMDKDAEQYYNETFTQGNE